MTMWSGPSNNILCLESSQLQQLLTCQLLVQSTICVQPFVTPWTAAHQASLSLNVYWSFPEFMFIASVMPSKHLILCCPLLLLPSIFPSIRVFSYDTCKCMFIASIHVNACSFPESFPMLFASAGQNIGALASASVLLMNIQDWGLSSWGWTGWISLQSKGLSRVFYNTTVQKHQFFSAQLSSQSNSHIHTWPLEKP